MRNMGHKDIIRETLNFEKTDRTPVHNFANIVAVRSAGFRIVDSRYDPKISTDCAIRYAKMTDSDFIKPCIDTNVQFMDIERPGKVPLTVPDDNYTRITGNIINTAEDIDALEFYDPFDPRTCPKFTAGFVRGIEALADKVDEDWWVYGFCWAPMSFAGFLMGAEQMMMNLLVEPELVDSLCKKTAVMSRELQKRCIDAGAEMMWMADPTAGEDLIDWKTFDKYEKPRVAEVVNGVKGFRKDAPIFFHMCGYTVNTLKLLPDIGIQCFSCDFKTDLASARESAGKRMAIMGNVNPVGKLMTGTPEDVREEVYEGIRKCGMEGGYIVSTGCEVPRDTPDENVIMMGQAARDFWKKQ